MVKPHTKFQKLVRQAITSRDKSAVLHKVLFHSGLSVDQRTVYIQMAKTEIEYMDMSTRMRKLRNMPSKYWRAILINVMDVFKTELPYTSLARAELVNEVEGTIRVIRAMIETANSLVDMTQTS